jgi:hypothetical protein
MKLTGTVLRCSTRKVNSSGKETYVTNLLVLDRENSGGTNYAVEVWDDKPHQVTLMSEVALTVVGVVNKTVEYPPCGQSWRRNRQGQPGRRPRLRKLRLRRRWLPLPQAEKRAPNLVEDSAPEAEAKPPPLPFRLRPTLRGGS